MYTYNTILFINERELNSIYLIEIATTHHHLIGVFQYKSANITYGFIVPFFVFALVSVGKPYQPPPPPRIPILRINAETLCGNITKLLKALNTETRAIYSTLYSYIVYVHITCTSTATRHRQQQHKYINAVYFI